MGLYSVTVNELNVTTGSATGRTVISISAASTHLIRIVEMGISAQGVTATDPPVLIELARQTSAGTTPGATLTPIKMDPGHVSVKSTAFRGIYATDPTKGDVFENYYMTPYGGLFVKQWLPDVAPIIAASGRIGLIVTPQANVDMAAYIVLEEF